LSSYLLCACVFWSRENLWSQSVKLKKKKNLDLILTELTLPQHSLRKVGGMRYKHKMFKRSDKICHVMHAWLFSISFLRGRFHYLKFRMFLAQKEKIQGAQLKTVKMLFVLLYPLWCPFHSISVSTFMTLWWASVWYQLQSSCKWKLLGSFLWFTCSLHILVQMMLLFYFSSRFVLRLWEHGWMMKLPLSSLQCWMHQGVRKRK